MISYDPEDGVMSVYHSEENSSPSFYRDIEDTLLDVLTMYPEYSLEIPSKSFLITLSDTRIDEYPFVLSAAAIRGDKRERRTGESRYVTMASSLDMAIYGMELITSRIKKPAHILLNISSRNIQEHEGLRIIDIQEIKLQRLIVQKTRISCVVMIVLPLGKIDIIDTNPTRTILRITRDPSEFLSPDLIIHPQGMVTLT